MAPSDVGRALSGTVLDVGAGSGTSGRFLAPGAEWLALEPAPSARLVRAVEARPHSRLLQSVAEVLPRGDGDVDAAVCSTALCSVADPDGALAEILRVLRPGGRLVFFEHVAAPAGSGASPSPAASTGGAIRAGTRPPRSKGRDSPGSS